MALAHFLFILEVTFLEVKKLSQAGSIKPCLPVHQAIWLLCLFLGLFPEVDEWAPAFAKGLVSSLLRENTRFILHCKALLRSLPLWRKWDEWQVPGVLFISGYLSWSNSLNIFLHPRERTRGSISNCLERGSHPATFSSHRCQDWRMKGWASL